MVKAVSVIVATCDRPQDLRECLASILASSYPVQEVLVMDQSDDGKSQEVVAGFEDPRLQCFHLDTRGKSRALNIAVRSSIGEVLCFTDDDCLVAPGWVQAIVEEFERDPSLSTVLGQTPPKSLNSDAPLLATYVSSERRVFSRRRNPYGVGGGANMAYRGEAIARIGDFDEALGPGAPFIAVEDNEYFYRTFKLGLKVVYCPKAIVYHKQSRDKLGVAQRLREYRLGDGAFMAKYLLKLDLFPLAFYLMSEAKGVGKALLARDLPYLRHIARRVRFTMEGIVAYMRWHYKGVPPTSIRTGQMEDPGAP
jgi:GT2 family glycosyltransferase